MHLHGCDNRVGGYDNDISLDFVTGSHDAIVPTRVISLFLRHKYIQSTRISCSEGVQEEWGHAAYRHRLPYYIHN